MIQEGSNSGIAEVCVRPENKLYEFCYQFYL